MVCGFKASRLFTWKALKSALWEKGSLSLQGKLLKRYLGIISCEMATKEEETVFCSCSREMRYIDANPWGHATTSNSDRSHTTTTADRDNLVNVLCCRRLWLAIPKLDGIMSGRKLYRRFLFVKHYCPIRGMLEETGMARVLVLILIRGMKCGKWDDGINVGSKGRILHQDISFRIQMYRSIFQGNSFLPFILFSILSSDGYQSGGTSYLSPWHVVLRWAWPDPEIPLCERNNSKRLARDGASE